MGSETVHEELARLLAEVVRSGDQPVEVARRSRRAAAPISDLDDLVQHLDEFGCVPHVVTLADEVHGDPDGGEHEIVLGRCCYEAAATVAPAPVCGLHRGLLEQRLSGSTMSMAGLEPGDPCRAGCRVRVRLCRRLFPGPANA